MTLYGRCIYTAWYTRTCGMLMFYEMANRQLINFEQAELVEPPRPTFALVVPNKRP